MKKRGLVECTDATDECKTPASCMEHDPWTLAAIEDDSQTQQRSGHRDLAPEESDEEERPARKKKGMTCADVGCVLGMNRLFVCLSSDHHRTLPQGFCTHCTSFHMIFTK